MKAGRTEYEEAAERVRARRRPTETPSKGFASRVRKNGGTEGGSGVGASLLAAADVYFDGTRCVSSSTQFNTI